MKLKNVLIVVKNIEKSKQFYHDLFGLNIVFDSDENVILTEGLVLQDEKAWEEVFGTNIIPENNASDCMCKFIAVQCHPCSEWIHSYGWPLQIPALLTLRLQK